MEKDVFVSHFVRFSGCTQMLSFVQNHIMLGTVRNVPFGCFSYAYLSLFILSSLSLETCTKTSSANIFRAAQLLALMRSHLGGSAER